MASISRIFISIQISFFIIIILSALIYSIIILIFQRFRCHTNILTVNLCLTIIGCSLYWMSYSILLEFNIKELFSVNSCGIILYAQMMCTLQVSLAFISISIHRFCSIVYHTKNFFKTKQWLGICLISQWMIGLILSLPMFHNYWFCIAPPWKRIYILIMIVIIPSFLCIVINSLLFFHVHASSRRIQPQTSAIQIHNNNNNNFIHQQTKISHRDIYLLRNIIIMFSMFIGGYGPIHVATTVMNYIPVDIMVMRILSLIAELSLLFDIINLYVYNRQLRDYLKNSILKCLRL